MAAQVSQSRSDRDQHTLQAEPRTVVGRKVKQLRRTGVLPGNIYGKKVKSQSVQVNLIEFLKTFKEVGETGLVSLKVGSTEHPVLIHNVQLNSVTDLPVHADFLEVDLLEKVTATVQIEFTGESPIEKSQEGILVPQLREVEVEALPTDLPENITVDVSELTEVGQAIKVADLKVDKTKVEIKGDPEQIVVVIEEPAKVEEPVVAAPAEGEVAAAEGGAPAAEGETPATEGTEKAVTGENTPTDGKKE
ncbi:MAG: large subunit ribosomal protein L25 [Microgenomates group bacterium Gr01-1014_5]|nr:MAG: large subunit ribosomal protein L25 [Microgenomates group bacterium Gr01-1014_5]